MTGHPQKEPSASAPAGPLAGVKVIDLTSVMMGPYATMILGDYGADVIKVESPDGDVMRYAAPMHHPRMGAMYLQGNRNKRSIVLDLKKAGGRAALLRLPQTADVFVHNVRPAAMAPAQARRRRSARRSIRGWSTPACMASANEAHTPAGRPMTI